MPATSPDELLALAYGGLRDIVGGIDDTASWAATGCEGWSVRDLVFHLVGDAQRALVALHTPASRAADRDAVTYWDSRLAEPTGAAAGRRFTRVVASMFLDVTQLTELFAATTAAVLHAAGRAESAVCVETQGYVLTTGDLLRTLATEATLHHLDLGVGLPGIAGPSTACLTDVSAVLVGLLGRPLRDDWDDERWALVATGRAPLRADEHRKLGADAERLPLLR